MRKISLLIAAGVSLLAMVAGTVAAAPDERHLSIETNAQWNHGFAGVDVQVHVSCTGGSGFVSVQLSQSPPESQVTANGNGGVNVLCDGQQHQVGVNVQGGPFDVGKAFAVAQLFTPAAPFPETTSKTVNITF